MSKVELILLYVKRLGELSEVDLSKMYVYAFVVSIEHFAVVSCSLLFCAIPRAYPLGPLNVK